MSRPDPSLGAVTTRLNIGSTDHDALQLLLQKRFGRQSAFRLAYTLAQTEGNTGGDAFSIANFQQVEDYNLNANRGPTDFSRRHNFVFGGIWFLPGTTGVSVSGIVRALSGQAFTLTNSQFDSDLNGINFDPLSPGIYTGRGLHPVTVDFDGQRNGAAGPDYFAADVRLQYRRRLGDDISAAFVLEAFNLTNRVNFDNPSGDFFNPNRRGQPSPNFLNLRMTRSPRVLQLGFRIQF